MTFGGINSSSVGMWYSEHENLNSYRNYPFSESAFLVDDDGVELAVDVFVDAFLYPILQEPSELRISQLKADTGYVEVSAGDDAIAFGTEADGVFELYDSRGRHAGSIVCGPGWEREKASGRDRMFSKAWLSARACSPVIHAGVLSLSDAEDPTVMTKRRHVVFKGDDAILPHIEQGRKRQKLYFDVLPPVAENGNPVRQVIFAAVGKTLFSVVKASSDDDDRSALLTTPSMDKEDVCWQAHREDSVSVAVDVCEDGETPVCPPGDIPYRRESVALCADENGNISLVSDNLAGYSNAVVVKPVEGTVAPQEAALSSSMSQADVIAEGSKLAGKPIRTGNGIKISIPGILAGRA